MKNNILIGLVGHPSSGKDTVSAYLMEKYDFRQSSGGEFLRFYIKEHNLGEPTRELMHEVANKLRSENGPDYLIKISLENQHPRLVLNGIRTNIEAETLKKQGGILIALTAPIEVRYKRAGERGRIGDGVSFEEFKKIEEIESKNSDPNAQNVNAVMKMADYTIINDGSKETLENKIEEVLNNI